jgi:hypothetical protein
MAVLRLLAQPLMQRQFSNAKGRTHLILTCLQFHMQIMVRYRTQATGCVFTRHSAACRVMASAVVTICTASLTSTNSTFCPHSVFTCFVWIWEQTAITDFGWYLSLHLRWTSGTGTGLSPASIIPLLLQSPSRVFGFLSYFPTFRQIVILSSSRSILLDLEDVPFELQAQGHGVTFSNAAVRTCYWLPGAGQLLDDSDCGDTQLPFAWCLIVFHRCYLPLTVARVTWQHHCYQWQQIWATRVFKKCSCKWRAVTPWTASSLCNVQVVLTLFTLEIAVVLCVPPAVTLYTCSVCTACCNVVYMFCVYRLL